MSRRLMRRWWKGHRPIPDPQNDDELRDQCMDALAAASVNRRHLKGGVFGLGKAPKLPPPPAHNHHGGAS